MWELFCSALVLEKCLLEGPPAAAALRAHSDLWVPELRMYRPWATLNVFMVSFLQLLQGSDYGNGSVKVGELPLLPLLAVQPGRVSTQRLCGAVVVQDFISQSRKTTAKELKPRVAS